MKRTNPTSFKCRLRTVMKNILLPLEFVYVMQLSETLKGFPLSSEFFFFVTSVFFSHSLASCRLQCQTKSHRKNAAHYEYSPQKRKHHKKSELCDDAANQFKMQNQDTNRVKQRKMKQQVVSIVYHFQSSLEIGLIVFLVFLLQFLFIFFF